MRFCALSLVAVVVLVALGLVAPQTAQAKDYSMPRVDIAAELETDGTLNVQEQRAFDFDGAFTCVWWTFDNFRIRSSLQVNGVSLTRSAGSSVPLEEVPFQSSWRSSGGPGRPCYSVDTAQDSIYIFFAVEDESVTVALDYSVIEAVEMYSDVAELYWQYVGSQWAEPSRDVSCTIALPVPAGEQVRAGENVYAWGHGPLDGRLDIGEQGIVTYEVPKVSPGSFAEARIAFPADWMTDIDPSALRSFEGLPAILSEEQQWADEANAQRAASRLLIVICIIIGLVIIVWALVMFRRHGREYRPDFSEEYWRDVPDPDAQPPAIGRLWRWGSESTDDFTAAIMQLAHRGAIAMEKGAYVDSTGRTVEDYCMVRVPEIADGITAESDPVGRVVLDMLFGRFSTAGLAGEAPRNYVWFGTISEFGKADPEGFRDAMGRFQGALNAQVHRLDYFEAKGSILRSVMATIGVFCIVAGIFATVMIENFIPAIVGVVTGIIVLVISIFMTRLTRCGSEVRAKAAALKKWLQDFSALDERPPTDVKVWGEFMVYAYVFGIAEQVMKELRIAVPELFTDETVGTTYVPWWFWYTPHHMAGMGGSLASMLSNTISNTSTTVTSALSTNSSGGGFGGGFSVGGGGGFGGGGGGAR